MLKTLHGKFKYLSLLLFPLILLSACTTPTSNATPTPSPVPPTSPAQQAVGSEPIQEGNGKYVDYTQSELQSASGDVVLFFYAPWCPSCRQHDANLKADAANIPSDLTILRVDFDSETALRQKYGVTMQHTLVQVDRNGKELKKWNSLYTEYDLKSIVSKLI